MLQLARVGPDGNGGLQYQRKHPDKLFYRKTRTFFTSEDGSAEESWFTPLSRRRRIVRYGTERSACRGSVSGISSALSRPGLASTT